MFLGEDCGVCQMRVSKNGWMLKDKNFPKNHVKYLQKILFGFQVQLLQKLSLYLLKKIEIKINDL